MKAFAAALAAAALALGCSAPAPPPADTGGTKIGVVVLHGDGDDPYGQTLRFTRTLIRDGFLTDSPEMPWSARRSYDAGVAGMVGEIDKSVARLKSRGAQKIFVAGHDLGGAAALRYARLRRVDGLIALAPGQGAKPMRVKAGAHLEYFDPRGPMSLRDNAAAVRPGTPVLWVVGYTEDRAARTAEQAAFEALPRDPPAKLAEVAAGHADTPDAAGEVCAEWMREIAKR